MNLNEKDKIATYQPLHLILSYTSHFRNYGNYSSLLCHPRVEKDGARHVFRLLTYVRSKHSLHFFALIILVLSTCFRSMSFVELTYYDCGYNYLYFDYWLMSLFVDHVWLLRYYFIKLKWLVSWQGSK